MLPRRLDSPYYLTKPQLSTMSARSLQQCARCFSTSMRAAQQPIPVPADWQNAPIVTRRQTPAYQPADFSHIADQRARKAFEQTSKAYYLLLGHDPGACWGSGLPPQPKKC